MSRDLPNDKADQIFNLYDNQIQGYLNQQQLKELIDHLYFLVLYVFPSMIDSNSSNHKQIQHVKLEMLKSVSNSYRE